MNAPRCLWPLAARSLVGSAIVAAMLLVRSSAAQDVVWERLPDIPDYTATEADGFAFLPGPTPEADTLVLLHSAGFLRYEPTASGARAWVRSCYTSCRPLEVLVTTAGSVLIGAAGGPTATDRSTDGGRTWRRDVANHTATLFQSSLPSLISADGHGAIFGDTGARARRW